MNTSKVIGSAKHKLPKILNKEQLLKILKHTTDARLAMSIFLGVFQGLRLGELSYYMRKDNQVLKWEDVDFSYGEISILDAKNPKRFRSGYGKDRIVPIFDEFLHIFKLWRQLNPESVYVISERKDKSKPLKARTVQHQLAQVLKKSDLVDIDYFQVNGVPRYKYHFHTFRHVCATNLLRRGLKIEQVKEFLGHERIETTMVYLDMVKDDLKEAITHAYAYPKQRHYFLPTQQVDSRAELLRLENENLKMKLQLSQEMPLQVIQ